MTSHESLHIRMQPIISALKVGSTPLTPPGAAPRKPSGLVPEPPKPVTPFITISRQAGAGGSSIARLLVARLNALDSTASPWTNWDRELIEKVSADHHISAALIEALEDSHRSWLQDLFAGMSSTSQNQADELTVYRRVAATIRGLAVAGRVVIVGRGGAFITRKLPGGIHVRLVAPLDERVRRMAEQLHLDADAAARHVAEIDHNRHAFYHRYWPRESLSPEHFSLTINTGEVKDTQAAECIVPLVRVAQPRK